MEKAADREGAISLRVVGGIILLFFFLSGALGLIYEVIWTRLLRLVMGNTVYSVTTVLCAFMGGLALGSFWGGRLIDRREDPLRIYALLEGAIGIYCLFLPLLIRGAEPLYRLIYQQFHPSFYLFSLIRFFFSALLLLVPATLMGATLPVLSRFFVRSSEGIGRTVGKLYAVNTFGAVVGCSASGFVLIPLWGLGRTLYTAALLNLLICLGVYLLHLRSVGRQGGAGRAAAEEAGAEKVRREEIGILSRPFLKVLLVGYGLSGFAALVYEIAWTRVLSLIIGSSVYAFSLMLTGFIFGLALGSFIFSRFIDRRKDLIFCLAVIEMIIGFSALMVVPLFGRLPLFIVGIILQFAHSFWLLQVVEFGLIFLLLLIPTTMMGAAFPVASRLYTRSRAEIGRSVGSVYAANTLGAILGSFAGGFILIPWLGIQKTIVAAVLVNVVVGAGFLSLSPGFSRVRKGLMAAAAILTAVVSGSFLPAWNRALMSSGTYLKARELTVRAFSFRSSPERELEKEKILYYREGVSATIAVKEDIQGEIYFVINGKPDASSTRDLPTQELLAHIPLLLHPEPRSVLVIGLASGVTLGSAGLYPVERLDCVEICPAAVEACHYFDEVNYNILADPRVDLIIGDGRNLLSLSERRYDVITSEPSNPWIAGVADLFTREFFQLCRRRLNPGGLACVWIHAQNLENETFRSIVYTFQAVFPHVTIWESILAGDYLLIGSEEEITLDPGVLRRRLESERVAGDLKRIGIDSAVEFLGHFLMNEEAVKEYVRGARLHTDDNALVEFSAPRSLHRREPRIAVLRDINRYRGKQLSSLLRPEGEEEGPAEVIDQVGQLIKVKEHITRGHIYLAEEKDNLAVAEFKKAAALNPEDLSWAKGYVDVIFARVTDFFHQGLGEEALAPYQELLELTPDYAELHNNLAVAYLHQGNHDKAIAECKAALEIKPDYAEPHSNLAAIYLQQEKYDSALAESKAALAIKPDYVEAHINLGNAYLQKGQPEKAIAEYETALELRPDSEVAYYYLGLACYARGDSRQARKCWEKTLKLNPNFWYAKERLRELRRGRD